MSERVIHRLNFETGKFETVRTVTDPSSLQERFEDLAAVTREHAEGETLAMVAAVYCDGCGAVVNISKPELPAGWITNERGELCPDCQ